MIPAYFTIWGGSIFTLHLFFIAALILSSFQIWRNGRRLGFNEETLMNTTIMALLIGLVAAKIAYILILAIHSDFLISHLNWNDQLRSGYHATAGLLGVFGTIYIVAKRQRWDFWQAADLFSQGILAGAITLSLGTFLTQNHIDLSSNFKYLVQTGLLITLLTMTGLLFLIRKKRPFRPRTITSATFILCAFLQAIFIVILNTSKLNSQNIKWQLIILIAFVVIMSIYIAISQKMLQYLSAKIKNRNKKVNQNTIDTEIGHE